MTKNADGSKSQAFEQLAVTCEKPEIGYVMPQFVCNLGHGVVDHTSLTRFTSDIQKHETKLMIVPTQKITNSPSSQRDIPTSNNSPILQRDAQ